MSTQRGQRIVDFARKSQYHRARIHFVGEFLMRRRFTSALCLAMLAASATPAFAQIDLSGEWAGTFYEDLPHRGGMQLGDYTGLHPPTDSW
jgi:hypothetical protein